MLICRSVKSVECWWPLANFDGILPLSPTGKDIAFHSSCLRTLQQQSLPQLYTTFFSSLHMVSFQRQDGDVGCPDVGEFSYSSNSKQWRSWGWYCTVHTLCSFVSVKSGECGPPHPHTRPAPSPLPRMPPRRAAIVPGVRNQGKAWHQGSLVLKEMKGGTRA